MFDRGIAEEILQTKRGLLNGLKSFYIVDVRKVDRLLTREQKEMLGETNDYLNSKVITKVTETPIVQQQSLDQQR
jgi:hypothetical protein